VKLKPLSSTEVAMFVQLLPDPRPPCVQSREGVLDIEFNKHLSKRLAAGDQWAWCAVRIRLSWGEWEGWAYRDGLQYEDQDDFLRGWEAEEMLLEALRELNARVSHAYSLIQDREVQVLDPPSQLDREIQDLKAQCACALDKFEQDGCLPFIAIPALHQDLAGPIVQYMQAYEYLAQARRMLDDLERADIRDRELLRRTEESCRSALADFRGGKNEIQAVEIFFQHRGLGGAIRMYLAAGAAIDRARVYQREQS